MPLLGAADASPDTKKRAVDLGVAIQLTNILRDVGGDAVDLNRVYLPLEDLRATDARVGNALVHDPPGETAQGSWQGWRWRAPKVYGHQKDLFSGYPGAGGYLAHFPRDPEAGAALDAVRSEVEGRDAARPRQQLY